MLALYMALLENPEDEPKFEEFYYKFHKTVYHIAYDHIKNQAIAEESVQETFIQLAKNFHNINKDFNDSSVWNYVKIVSKSIAIDTYRKNKKDFEKIVNADITDFYSLQDEDFNIFDEIQLKSAIDNLPDDYRYVFYLKYVCNYSGEEIGKALNMSQPLVRKRCMIAKQKVKAYLEGDEKI